MTTSRLVRGTKARVFIYICAILIVTAIIACYNNTLQQLQVVKKSNEICHQQEDNLSQQIQVISDYKQRLENSLKKEKAEHQHTKNDLEVKLTEERSRNEKSLNDANIRISTLQQHFNLLQTQYDDYKEECSKTQNQLSTEINNLQAKLKEVQGELKKVEGSKENLKTQYLEMQTERENLQKLLKENLDNKGENESEVNHLTKVNHELHRELDYLKDRCPVAGIHEINEVESPIQTSPRSINNFNVQQPIGPDEYRINVGNNNGSQSDQKQANFIKMPTRSTTSASLKLSQPSLNNARPLLVPNVTPSSTRKSNLPLPEPAKVQDTLALPPHKIPEGVVHVDEKQLESNNEENELPKNPETANNRYLNQIETGNEEKKGDEGDQENGANEEMDAIGFGDSNNPVKTGRKQAQKHHNSAENEYKDRLENEPEDDDPEDYDLAARGKDAVVRN